MALWSGEEEGLLGSLAYVKQHFGTFENPKPEFAKLDCYFNVDTGTGRLRGAGIFGPRGSGGGAAAGAGAIHGLGRLRRQLHQQPRDRRHGQHVVQQRRTAGRGLPAGPDRVQLDDASHQSGHLRAHHSGRCAEGRGDCGGFGLARRQSRPDGAAVYQRDDAARRWKRARRMWPVGTPDCSQPLQGGAGSDHAGVPA